MPSSFQRAALAASLLLLAGCACGGLVPAAPTPRPFTLPPVVPGPTPEGVTISRSGFDGGAFSAVFTVHSQASEPGPAAVLEQIAPTLRAAGFRRSLADLGTPDGPIALEPPDLGALAGEVCREAALRESRSSGALCGALTGGGPPPAEADEAVRGAYGLGYGEWKAGLERLSFQYPFPQVVEGVPIEGAGVSAFRRDGESISMVQGSLFDRFTVANEADFRRRDALVGAALSLLHGRPVSIGEPELVLIPDGTERKDGEAVPVLRYAWRILVGLPDRSGRLESWVVWADASRGTLLRVASQWKAEGDPMEVEGVRWRRDPGLCKPGSPSCTEVVRFQVDPPKGDKLVLALKGVFLPVEEDSDPGIQVKLSAGGFNQSPINDGATAVCSVPGNSPFRQVNAYSHLYSLWKIVGSAGLVPTFPEKPLKVVVDDEDPGDTNGSAAFYDSAAGKGDARSSLWLSDGQGSREPACPAAVGSRLSGAQDVTVMAHETSHLLVQRLQERRPADWCKCSKCKACPMPDVLGHNILHDFADGLAFSYASTNCYAGWTAKNLDGVDAHLYCQGATSEAGQFPREAELPADRFPEHRGIDRGEYANGQIAAAALWEIRKGLRSKAFTAGTEEYWVRLLRSLWTFGFLANTCSFTDFYPGTTRIRYNSCDRDVFLYLQDLERRMVAEWASAGPLAGQTAAKVVSGWAKAGVYLTPFVCLDGDLATTDPGACPSDPKHETSPEAAIEIDDQDPGDDLEVDGVVHPEVDYLRKDGPPRFLVWTGPHYRFSGDGTALLGAAPPCGDRYEVELAADPDFTAVVWTSGQRAGQACSGEVALSAADWESVQAHLAGPKVYYRARVWDALGRERLSTLPGAGAFQIDAPFAVISETGKP